MRYIALILTVLCWGTLRVAAQNEVKGDSVSTFLTNGNVQAGGDKEIPSAGIQPMGDFLIDMDLMKLHTAPKLTDFKLEIPDASKDYNALFRLSPDVTYSSGVTYQSWWYPTGSPWFYSRYGLNDWDITDNLQMGSFRLKNGMRINTYGHYNKDGYRVANPSALPWERNNFKGAFELKSENGAFGIRIEVEQGQKTPFGAPMVPMGH